MIDNLNKKISYKKENLRTIYLAGGCFWGVEAYISRLLGVAKTTVGYANGNTENPTYDEVCLENTNHVECVKVDYDNNILPLKKLLEEFFKIINPLTINKQGNDVGVQYRTGIYYRNETDKRIIINFINRKQGEYSQKIVTEVLPLNNFYPAEKYHQKYLEKNPTGYCHIDLTQLPNQKKQLEELLIKEDIMNLTPIEFDVTQKNATEKPFSGKYNDFNKKGLYVDVVGGEPLFISDDKFDSKCGWPSFTKPVNDSHIQKLNDTSHGMKRIEVRSKKANSHLGHVFDDGPRGEKRYCINSASMRFIMEGMLNILSKIIDF
ncbi:peptide-methionine (S)-S-oxide reductase MsrA [Methanosphaera stadtmanae]|uniref:peptide-methionine (S)-S-oxide reductase MsrA n=1 Tax=Methanosphaera stadtmanae TaxID=2317 RepID=UPI0026758A7C|nr:peptide-methionine (S)-S-oxide reductase MsrA [Methanosphaera stadtmanae]